MSGLLLEVGYAAALATMRVTRRAEPGAGNSYGITPRWNSKSAGVPEAFWVLRRNSGHSEPVTSVMLSVTTGCC
jgi:hypothetical protein